MLFCPDPAPLTSKTGLQRQCSRKMTLYKKKGKHDSPPDQSSTSPHRRHHAPGHTQNATIIFGLLESCKDEFVSVHRTVNGRDRFFRLLPPKTGNRHAPNEPRWRLYPPPPPLFFYQPDHNPPCPCHACMPPYSQVRSITLTRLWLPHNPLASVRYLLPPPAILQVSLRLLS